MRDVTIGILNLQGAVYEHECMLKRIPNVTTMLVKYVHQLDEIDGLIIPGGESTTMGRLLREFNLLEPLRQKIKAGLPVFGTCAGMILLAKKLSTQEPTHLAVMDIEVTRNAYGRQLGSFSVEVTIPSISDKQVPLVFIRAPFVTQASDDVTIHYKIDDHIVACQQNNMLATSFHPELTNNNTFHHYFVNMVKTKIREMDLKMS